MFLGCGTHTAIAAIRLKNSLCYGNADRKENKKNDLFLVYFLTQVLMLLAIIF